MAAYIDSVHWNDFSPSLNKNTTTYVPLHISVFCVNPYICRWSDEYNEGAGVITSF